MLGRPRILCETRQREFCVLISVGCTLEAAASYVDCSPITIRREARRNPEFQEKLRAARANAELSPIRTMCVAANSYWRAAAWLLERTQPQRYARRAPNTFTQQEVVELLGRVCDIVRRETRDQERYDRIQRCVKALAQKTVCQEGRISLDLSGSPADRAAASPRQAPPRAARRIPFGGSKCYRKRASYDPRLRRSTHEIPARNPARTDQNQRILISPREIPETDRIANPN
jgi:hypothetical protein